MAKQPEPTGGGFDNMLAEFPKPPLGKVKTQDQQGTDSTGQTSSPKQERTSPQDGQSPSSGGRSRKASMGSLPPVQEGQVSPVSPVEETKPGRKRPGNLALKISNLVTGGPLSPSLLSPAPAPAPPTPLSLPVSRRQSVSSNLPGHDSMKSIKQDPDIIKVSKSTGGWSEERQNTAAMVSIILLRMSRLFCNALMRSRKHCEGCVFDSNKRPEPYDPFSVKPDVDLLEKYVDALVHFDAKTGKPPRSLAEYVGKAEKETLKACVNENVVQEKSLSRSRSKTPRTRSPKELTLWEDFKDFCRWAEAAVTEDTGMTPNKDFGMCAEHQKVFTGFTECLDEGIKWKDFLKTIPDPKGDSPPSKEELKERADAIGEHSKKFSTFLKDMRKSLSVSSDQHQHK